MQIQRIHDDQHPYSPPTGPHTQPSRRSGDATSVSNRENEAASFLQSAVSAKEFPSFIEKLRELPEQDDEAIQLAIERFRSGQLITREVAESLATSSLKEFIF
ncbi:hypothetical protein AB1L42_19770 [Thalassoglobus sp. JC818]|uniref:hypothetical protein n=1 Tax=Thalassoglobus sp. JC818 TaxID=3232136 RepID=UPI003458C643